MVIRIDYDIDNYYTRQEVTQVFAAFILITPHCIYDHQEYYSNDIDEEDEIKKGDVYHKIENIIRISDISSIWKRWDDISKAWCVKIEVHGDESMVIWHKEEKTADDTLSILLNAWLVEKFIDLPKHLDYYSRDISKRKS